MASDRGRVFTPRFRFVRLGRFSDVEVRSPRVAYWLQAVGQRIANYVGLTPSSGNLDAEFLLLSVQRIQADEPWTATCDPFRTLVNRFDNRT